MASQNYNEFPRKALNGTIVIGTDTFKAMLLTSTYTPSKNHAFRSDLTNEVTGTGYTAGGNACTAAIGAVDTANNRVDVTFTPTAWATATITARYCAIYKSRGGLATADELVTLDDFGADVSSTAAAFTVAAILARFQN